MSGLLILLLGVWGGLIPFVGPYFHYAFGGFKTWHFTDQRLWLNIAPGVAAVVAGLMLMRAATRVGGLTAGWVAVAAGVWFAVGPVVSILWHHTIYAIGAPMGGHTRQMLEWIGYFYGLGVAIVGLAAFAMGRYFSRPRVITEAAAVAEEPVAVAERDGTADRAPVADRAAVADEPVTAADRGPVADGEPAMAADRGPVADGEPAMAADRGPVADGEPATIGEHAPVADEREPLDEEPAAGAVPAETAYPQDGGARPRRGGLLGLLRR